MKIGKRSPFEALQPGITGFKSLGYFLEMVLHNGWQRGETNDEALPLGSLNDLAIEILGDGQLTLALDLQF